MTQYYKWFGDAHNGFVYDLTPGAINHLGNDEPLALCRNGLHYTTFQYADQWKAFGNTLMVIEVLDTEHGLQNDSDKAVCRAFKVVRPAVEDALQLCVVAAANAEMSDMTLHDPNAMARWCPNTVQRFFQRICRCPCMKVQVEEVLGFALDVESVEYEYVSVFPVHVPTLFEIWAFDQLHLKHLKSNVPRWYIPTEPKNCSVTAPQFKRYKDKCWYMSPEAPYFLADCGCRYTFNQLLQFPEYIWPQLFSMHTNIGRWGYLFECSPYDTIEAFMTKVYPLLTNFTTFECDFTRALYEYSLIPKPDNDSAICLVNFV